MKYKYREAIGFILLLFVFITLVMCREDVTDAESKHPIREYICPNKSNVLSILGGLFIAMVVQRMFCKFKEKRERTHKQA